MRKLLIIAGASGLIYYFWRAGLFNKFATGATQSQLAPIDFNPLTNGTFSMKNNNPGNLRGNIPWQGAQGTGQGGFTVFDSAANGLRALMVNLLAQEKQGMNTVRQIIAKYAPSSDNNPTSAYISNVASALGVSPDAPLNLSDPRTLQTFAAAIVRQEQGKQIFGADDYASAYRSATGKG